MAETFRMIPDDDMALNGWAAWSRDHAGLVCTAHAPFETAAEWAAYVAEETLRGLRVFYPPGRLLIKNAGREE